VWLKWQSACVASTKTLNSNSSTEKKKKKPKKEMRKWSETVYLIKMWLEKHGKDCQIFNSKMESYIWREGEIC
jgi:hypothetical protein